MKRFAVAWVLLFACTSQPAWQIQVSDDSNWLLAVAPLPGQVLAVGGQPGAGPGQPGSGLILEVPFDTTVSPKRSLSPQPGMLWWVHTLADASAWLCGEGGSVLRYEAASNGPPDIVAIPSA